MKKILIIDIETTGFSHSKNHIVEVGIVELDLDTGIRKIIFNNVIHEDNITKEEIEKAWIIENSDLTSEKVMNANSLDFWMPEIKALISRYPLGATAYNNKFDFGFLENRGIIIRKKLPCPMLISRIIINAKDKNNRIKQPTAEEAYHYFFPETEYIEKHRGADDAMHEAEIVYELYKLGIFTL